MSGIGPALEITLSGLVCLHILVKHTFVSLVILEPGFGILLHRVIGRGQLLLCSNLLGNKLLHLFLDSLGPHIVHALIEILVEGCSVLSNDTALLVEFRIITWYYLLELLENAQLCLARQQFSPQGVD